MPIPTTDQFPFVMFYCHSVGGPLNGHIVDSMQTTQLIRGPSRVKENLPLRSAEKERATGREEANKAAKTSEGGPRNGNNRLCLI